MHSNYNSKETVYVIRAPPIRIVPEEDLLLTDEVLPDDIEYEGMEMEPFPLDARQH